MKILFLATHANTGGITSYLLTLSKQLRALGHQVWVVSSGGNCVPEFEAMGVCHVTLNIRVKSEVHPRLWMYFNAINRLIQQEKIDVIHAQTRVTQVLGTCLSRINKIGLVTTCHGFFKPRWFRKIFPCWGEAVIAISKPVARHLREDFGVPEKRIYQINNGIDLSRFVLVNEQRRMVSRQEMDIGSEPLIGIIARLSDVKGIDVLIKAMPLVLKKVPSARLLIAGEGPQENRLKKLTQELLLTSQVIFKCTVNETPKLLAAFDVFVMPSLMEGLGLSVMEAQACGIPVVASRVGGLIDLIQDGQSGFLVSANNHQALADRIITVLGDPEASRAMAQQARLNIETHFSASQMVQATLKVYEQYSRR